MTTAAVEIRVVNKYAATKEEEERPLESIVP